MMRRRAARMPLRIASAAMLLVASAVVPGSRLAAQLSPNGPEFQVNSYTTSSQYSPDVASDPAGNFVVVWTSLGSPGTDSAYASIQGQRFRVDGTLLGAQFQVNTYTTKAQKQPAVAADAQGNFVVVWRSYGAVADASGSSVQGQRYAANGTPIGGQFQVNSFTTSYQDYPAVAEDALGNFVVAWESGAAGNGDSDGVSVQAQRYAVSGAAQGGQFLVNAYTTGHQRSPDVAADGQGNFLIAWHSFGSIGGDISTTSAQARRYTGSGAPLGAQFQVNSYITNSQNLPAVAADALGNFVLAWESDGSAGADTSGLSVQARRFDSSGVAAGGDFQVNVFTTDWQRLADVAMDSQGGFVVVWESFAAVGDTSSRSVHARRYLANGTPREAEFQVNTYTTNYQVRPAVASDARGNFVVVWHSLGSSGTDTSAQSVRAQRYDALFRDGFAGGDLLRWSAAVP